MSSDYENTWHSIVQQYYAILDGDVGTNSIDHLIFFIHGVGGVCDTRFRSCVDVVADFKKMANTLLSQQSDPPSRASTPSNRHLAKHLKKGFFRKRSTESSASRSSDTDDTPKSISPNGRTRRIECLPISWHSCTRKQIGMNDQLNLISLNSVPKLRHFLNKVVMDALLYSSGPVYNQTIMTNVGNEINRLYSLFMENHPNFNGSVSLAGHSLGSVILFDLLANQLPFDLDVPLCPPNNDSNSSSSENNNNNHNNNNNNDEGLLCNEPICRNISHKHHNHRTPRNCMDYKSLEDLLKDMDLMQHSGQFQKKGIDINSLLSLTDLDMKEMNLPLGARQKLGTYINFKKVSMLLTTPEAQQENTQQQEQSASEIKSKIRSNLLDNMNTGQFLIKYPQLKFKPKCFFAFGSPMPMFLNMRGIQTISKDYKLPTCDRMINIFHPYDPLAYRVEPLIDPRFKNVDPVLIPHHRGGKRIHVQLREGFAKVGSNIKHSLFNSIKNTWTTFTRFGGGVDENSRSPSLDSSSENNRRKLTKSVSHSVEMNADSGNINIPPKHKRLLKRQQLVKSQSDAHVTGSNGIFESSIRQSSNGSTDLDPESTVINHLESFKLSDNENESIGDNRAGFKAKRKRSKSEDKSTERTDSVDFDQTDVGRLNGGRRLDYVLQEKPIELFNEYIFAFTSHANYWQNEDSALIILNEIYRVDDGIQMFDFD